LGIFLYLLLIKSVEMLTNINPKLPMRNKKITMEFYINKLGFKVFGNADYEGYLMVEKDNIQIHFLSIKT